ncbi:helix-turn-helix transcriptional regulator [Lacibacter sediminis]|uniref:Helix-turn-helix transcriptional regulator n=1 Tax=Lacibacter sediminis TaxID=2760713 RepID=A0A7G5XI85_9BACT|nr:helix-turn-helix transcriptional regulator [Lacibacter sediminis]QNA45188.1 helix-turn-helix transcriptional regulator [Lacibacter sediminis]
MKNKVKEQRLIQEISQTEFAEQLSVSRQTIHAIETGKYIPTTTLALKIAKLLNKKVEEVFILEKGD